MHAVSKFTGVFEILRFDMSGTATTTQLADAILFPNEKAEIQQMRQPQANSKLF
jgi:hypothetical protein